MSTNDKICKNCRWYNYQKVNNQFESNVCMCATSAKYNQETKWDHVCETYTDFFLELVSKASVNARV